LSSSHEKGLRETEKKKGEPKKGGKGNSQAKISVLLPAGLRGTGREGGRKDSTEKQRFPRKTS